jgi:hypothetical protein
VGPGAPIPGNPRAFGIVNYTEWKFSKKDFLSVRPIDYIVDFKGERSGFATTMASWTVGVTHRFNDLVSVRPEARCEYVFSARPSDNGTRKGSVDVRNGCVLALLAQVIQSLLGRVLRNVIKDVGQDSIKHCCASPC